MLRVFLAYRALIKSERARHSQVAPEPIVNTAFWEQIKTLNPDNRLNEDYDTMVWYLHHAPNDPPPWLAGQQVLTDDLDELTDAQIDAALGNLPTSP